MHYFSILFILLLIPVSAAHGQNLSSANEYSQRAMARFEKNDLDGAIADFTKVIEMKGESLEFCYYFRGIAHYRKGNPDQAIVDLSQAIAIKADPRFYDDRGNLLARQGELERAIADLNKAIELAPGYAKAYGDRGLVRVMRSEDAEAELDFKKCFELDRTLEDQFRTAANKIRQRALSSHAREKPSDIEVNTFSWKEAPSKVLIAPSSPTIAVTTSAVSATGTRVLANPNEKGQPGPPELSDPSGSSAPSAREPPSNTRDVIAYKFTVSLKNTGQKTIVAVKWAYYFDSKDSAHEGLAYLFTTKANIAPGREKSLNDSIVSPGDHVKMPHKSNQALFNERIAILRLDYADGSFWEASEAARVPQKTRPAP